MKQLTVSSNLGSPGTQHNAVYLQPTLCSLQGIGSGTASSLPFLVLRSMLKQRRILMRMH